MDDSMGDLASSILRVYAEGHREILALAEQLSDDELRRQPAPSVLPIAFHLWHVARWADFTQAVIPGMTPDLSRLLPPSPQIWEAERLADRWGFVTELGAAATGMDMDDTTAARLPYPSKDQLLAYTRQAFAAVEQAAASIPPDQMQAHEQWQPLTDGIWGDSTVGDALLDHVAHDALHLGHMQSLAGLLHSQRVRG